MDRKASALKHVSEALNLDSSGFHQAAFAKYLQSVQILTLYLNDLFVSLGFQKMIAQRLEVIQVLSMLHECSDRIAAIINNGAQKVPTETSGSGVNHSRIPENIREYAPSKKFPAFEKMQNENMLLFRSYKNRLERAVDNNTKCNLKLEFERRLAENAVVAKAKYDAAVKKLQRERAQMMENEIRKLFDNDSNLNGKEREKQLLYTTAVNYAKTEMWPSSWKLNSTEYSASEAVEKIFLKIIKCPSHPLSQWIILVRATIKREVDFSLKNYSEYIPVLLDFRENVSYSIAELSSELVINSSKCKDVVKIPFKKLSSLQNSLESVSSEIISTIANFLQIFYLIYRSLLPDDSEVICYSHIEAYLLEPIWPNLIILYRILNISLEYSVSETMSAFRTATPSKFGISSIVTDVFKAHNQTYPLLQKLIEYKSVVKKLKILVEVTHIICDSSFQAEETPQRRVGADELIPLLCYIIVQSQLPQLVSECCALEQLFDMKYMFGEEGYALSSFLTALKYIEIKKLEN